VTIITTNIISRTIINVSEVRQLTLYKNLEKIQANLKKTGIEKESLLILFTEGVKQNLILLILFLITIIISLQKKGIPI